MRYQFCRLFCFLNGRYVDDIIFEDKVMKKVLESKLHEISDNYVIPHRESSYSRIILKEMYLELWR